jgi:serine phosphatase RsbU (regulator of sigma subunit)
MTWKYTSLLLLLFFNILFWQSYAQQSTHIVTQLKDTPESYSLGQSMYLLEDKTTTVLFQDILTADYQNKFTLSKQESINLGFSTSAYWFKFQLKNTSEFPDWYFILSYPQIDYFEFYAKNKQGGWTKKVFGDKFPFKEREVNHHDFLIHLDLPKDSVMTYYIKVQTESSLQLPMSVQRTNAFFQENGEAEIGYGLYYGIMLTMILYNLFVYFSLRDVNYIFYVLSIFSSTMFFMTVSGYGFRHFWYAYPALNQVFAPMFMGLWVFFSAIFTQKFIDVQRYIPRISRILYVSIAMGVMSVTLAWVAPYRVSVKIASVTVALNVIIILGCSIVSYFRKNISAKFFILAWFLFLVGTLLIVLSRAGIVPTNFFTSHGVEFGSVLEVLLLSFALSDRYKLIKIENEKIQKEANETLEQKVRQRTQELREMNEELKQINEELNVTLDTVQYQKQEIEKKNYDITSSINYARRIQKAMLPSETEVVSAFPNSFILFKPKDIVSGDFYWISTIKSGGFRSYNARRVVLGMPEEEVQESVKQMIAVVDCTGHGVPGAMMSMIGMNLLNEIVNLQGITEVDKVLKELQHGVNVSLSQKETENKDGMVISLCVIDKANNKLEYAAAKHPLVYIQDDDNGQPKMTIIKGEKSHIGGELQHEGSEAFVKHTIDISKPTTFYTFSDGYPDQFGGIHNKKFMANKLCNLLFDNHQLPMEMQKSLLDNTIEEWMWLGKQKQIDDILVVGVKI